mmetsp:Transcript_52270/g.106531  ORF Transcript_52270/g.106531 Transcript_52270/m.106531 type:complete len:166 (-) Transcript_52270:216-713(-)|eukprot:CAMPEP_0181322720 /NCGR_PEP_ID=MMETSP1101-20121128/19380_1 /TAXON_ID=46948 /ORGANISM="Rhodomonas abbreviata, Strain Caron Lab Isolate" /LENGTH=165 /DNA_ID=CAMNT_0023430655 /DNA_START=23 /DNA_END=520 /DNA_ORIENTATION=+
MAAGDEYWSLFSAVLGALFAKYILISILSVRPHLAGNNIKEKEDDSFFLKWLFKILLVAYGPGMSAEFETRCANNSRNSMENEFWFAILYAVVGMTCTPPPAMLGLMKIFLICRCLHFLLHVILPLQPFRAFAWMGGLACNVFAMVIILQQKGSLLMDGNLKLEL